MIKQELQILISACNQFYRLAGKEIGGIGGLVFGLYPVELVLKELNMLRKNLSSGTIYLFRTPSKNISIFHPNITPKESYQVDFGISNINFFDTLTQAVESLLDHLQISSEDLKDRFEKPDFMGEQFMPEDYV